MKDKLSKVPENSKAMSILLTMVILMIRYNVTSWKNIMALHYDKWMKVKKSKSALSNSNFFSFFKLKSLVSSKYFSSSCNLQKWKQFLVLDWCLTISKTVDLIAWPNIYCSVTQSCFSDKEGYIFVGDLMFWS